MAKKAELYITFDRYLFRMTDAELNAALGGIKEKSVLLRSILMNELEHYKASDFYRENPGATRSMRALWYQSVKILLSRIGKLKANDEEHLCWQRRSGSFDYVPDSNLK